jgi:DNA excision repair protein ERCC-4
LKGGVLSITTRILIVDMLNKRIPVDLVTGILINHAHRITEISPEAFILRLYRNENQQGFIRAFSDEPESFATGIWKLEKSMKVLYQRHVHLWPRFHVQVKHDIEKHAQVDMIELRIPMTQCMKEVQQGLWECLDQCLAEIKRSNPTLQSDDYTVENASFRAFDYIIRSQLEPNWHRVSGKTKNLLQDLKTIRKLLGYMSSYDCVTFYSFLETLVAAAAPTTVFKTEPSSPWLMLDAAQIVIASARKRVYRQRKKSTTSSAASPSSVGVKMEPVLEEQPKWKILLDVIKEIHEEKAQGDAEGLTI